MNVTQTYVNITPTALGLRFMPPQGVSAPNTANYTTTHLRKAIGQI